MKVVRLSALRTGHLYLQETFLVLISVKRLSRPQGHSAAGRMMSMKKSNGTIGNRTRDLPACSAVPELLMPDINILFLTCLRTINVHKSKHVTVNCSLGTQSGVGVTGRLHCAVFNVLIRGCIINLKSAVLLGGGVYR
jgi:hypothetical protein